MRTDGLKAPARVAVVMVAGILLATTASAAPPQVPTATEPPTPTVAPPPSPGPDPTASPAPSASPEAQTPPSTPPSPSASPQSPTSPTPSASADDPSASPGPSASPTPATTPTPSVPPTPSAGPDPSASPGPTSSPAPTTSVSPSPSPSATPTAASDDLIPTTETGGVTITGPTSVQVTVVEESHVRVDVRGIEVVDTRTTPEPFTATATVKNIRRDGAPVQIEGIQWQTAAVTDGDGIPIPGLITAEGNLLDRAVILGGTSGGGPNRYLVDGVITVPIAGLPDGDYAFTLSTSIS